uniref:Isoamyl acetate-hydrolyzing esterase 1 homolog n=1 Tax=Phallusia mammillata TaxID=59560 RepID=A0A6F9DF65_9ASCI|nr:isoamyl acetate-hydrolyzing esterase 1 homolog [Phallusia mammillata]
MILQIRFRVLDSFYSDFLHNYESLASCRPLWRLINTTLVAPKRLGHSHCTTVAKTMRCFKSWIFRLQHRVTDHAIQFLSKIIDAKLLQDVVFVTIFFGANDAVLPECYTKQHVPVDRYQTNLVKIVEHFQSLGITSEKIILIAPPPVDAELRAKDLLESGDKPCLDRINDATIEYAKACVKVANSKKCRVIDLFTLMINKHLPTYLHDGLHFSDEGNSLLASELSTHVEELTKELDVNLPDWKDLCGVE